MAMSMIGSRATSDNLSQGLGNSRVATAPLFFVVSEANFGRFRGFSLNLSIFVE